MQAFIDQLAVISPLVPGIVRFLILVALGLLTWIVVSIPCYWLARAVAGPIERFIAAVTTARLALLAVGYRLFTNRRRPVELFMEQHALMFSLGWENKSVRDRLATIRTMLARIPPGFEELGNKIQDAQKATREAATTLQRLRWPDPIEAPSNSEYGTIRVADNDGILRAIAFGFFAIALVAINTLMLKEFFASFVPPLKMFGVTLPVVVACFFSIIEMSFGACLAFVDGMSTGAIIGRAVLVVSIALLGLIEFGFYAKFAADYDFNPFAVVWAPDRPPSWTRLWFGIFGPLIVLGMAYAGDMLFEALRTIFRNNVVRQYEGFLRRRTKVADDLKRRLDDADKTYASLSRVLRDLPNQFKSTIDDAGEGNASFARARQELDAAIAHAQQTNLAPYVEVAKSEMRRVLYRSAFQALSIFVAFLVIALSFGAFGFAAPISLGGVVIPGVAIAIGETVLMLGAGSIMQRVVEFHVGSGAHSGHIAAFLAYAVSTAVVLADAIPFVSRLTFVDFMWFAFASAAALWLLAIGARIGLLIAAVSALCPSAAIWLGITAQYAGATILFGLYVAAQLVLFLLTVISFPYTVIFGKAARPASVLILALLVGASIPLRYANAQDLQAEEPQSSIHVLVDLSGTWLNPASVELNKQILKTVAGAIEQLVSDVEPPIKIRYLPIGDLSLAREPLCEVVFIPALLQRRNSGTQVSNLKDLDTYLAGSCAKSILSRKWQPFTDITSALDSVGRAVEEQAGAFKGIIVLSDLKEERRQNQKSGSGLRLSGTHTLLLYRVLEEDRVNPAALDARLDAWKKLLTDDGSKVHAINDITAAPAQISRVMKE